VCFITSTGGRTAFLGTRIPMRPATVVDTSGVALGELPAIEMVTLGQRRGIGLPGGGPKQYVIDIDVPAATVTVGDESALYVNGHTVTDMAWVHGPQVLHAYATVLVQCSAHGTPLPARVSAGVDGGTVTVQWLQPQRRIANGQSMVLYDPHDRFVLGGGITAAVSANG